MRNGWTLIELLVVLLVLGVVATQAVPAFTRMTARNRLVVATNALAGALRSARQWAIEKNRPVAFCAGDPDTGCSGDWSARRWQIFMDSNHDGRIDTDEPVLASGRFGRGAGQLVVMGNGPFLRAVEFTPIGTAQRVSGALGAGRLRLCSRAAISPNAADLVLAAGGRVRIEHHDFGGNCPAP